jgi:aspartate racemase
VIAGLVGGLGPEATIDYYRRLLAAWESRFPGTSPPLVIDSLDAARVFHLAATDRPGLVEYIAASVHRLESAGVHFAVITSNTTHLVYEDVAARARVPMISIVETCADEAVRRGFGRCLLLGTRNTMDGTLYPTAFSKRGIRLFVPEPAERVWIHDRYVNQLVKGIVRDETREELVALVRQMHETHALDAVILGGTELPLLFREPTIAGLAVLDTTGLHVDAIIRRLAPD